MTIISNHTLHITLYLTQDTAQPKVTGISVQDVLAVSVGKARIGALI